jgi:hypothetical protein
MAQIMIKDAFWGAEYGTFEYWRILNFFKKS